MSRVDLFGTPVDPFELGEAIDELGRRIEQGARATACFANVHVVETARADQRLAEALRGADVVFADGAPVAWAVRLLHRVNCTRVAGADVFAALNARAAERGYAVFFLGGREETLRELRRRLEERLPNLVVCGSASPPFRPLTAEETAGLVETINAASPDIVWVGLGAPKQEIWMAENRSALAAPLLAGVGAVFDFASGSIGRAPVWLQVAGMEWFYRLLQEPRRLWRRYAVTNTTFLVHLGRALALRGRLG
jgi:N-acetylglucosaminyldiphosphoundecaprenol N-acetyl-beta-D-mannosaminyltransferase